MPGHPSNCRPRRDDENAGWLVADDLGLMGEAAVPDEVVARFEHGLEGPLPEPDATGEHQVVLLAGVGHQLRPIARRPRHFYDAQLTREAAVHHFEPGAVAHHLHGPLI